MTEPVQPLPGEVALWGRLQSGRRPGAGEAPQSRYFVDRRSLILFGVVVPFCTVLATVWRRDTPLADVLWTGAFMSVFMVAPLGVVGFAERRARGLGGAALAPRNFVNAPPPATAWFLSPARLVVSSPDGRGESIPVQSLRSARATFAQGAPAVELHLVWDGRQSRKRTVLAADARRLLDALEGLGIAVSAPG